jgi:hypothetical protein
VSDVTYGTATMALNGKNDAVEFKTATFKYSTSLVESQSVITARSIDGYVMGVRFFCQTPAFSENLNKDLVSKLSLNMTEQQ